MRHRNVTTNPAADNWIVFDQLEPGDDAQLPALWAQTDTAPESLGPTPEAALAEWNNRKRTALATGQPILIYAGRKAWTRDQVIEALASNADTDGDINFT